MSSLKITIDSESAKYKVNIIPPKLALFVPLDSFDWHNLQRVGNLELVCPEKIHQFINTDLKMLPILTSSLCPAP